jgi:hypothetical protein
MKWFHFRKQAGSYKSVKIVASGDDIRNQNIYSQSTICRCRSSMSAVTSAFTFNTSRQSVLLGATSVTAASALATPPFAAGVEAVTRTSPTTHEERQ